MLQVKQLKTAMILICLGVIQVFSFSAYAESYQQNGLTDWSEKMNNTMSVKMDRKLQQIVMEAQILQNLEQESRQLIALTGKAIGCEPEIKVTKIQMIATDSKLDKNI